MVKFDIPDIRKDLPMSMTMAAFAGIAWYICIELNVRLFYLFKRRKGLYFWSCALCSWGIFFQPLTIILADFQVITNTGISIPLIYLSWWLMTIPQSLVMYSRLGLVMHESKYLRWVLWMIIFTTVVISFTSMVTGPISQQPDAKGRRLVPFYSVWIRIENATWVIQETVISVLYIIYTNKHLKDTSIFSTTASRQVMHHLIATNLLIIILDIALLAIQYAGLFYLGGSMKPALYGLKLRIEFSILNRLVAMTRERGMAIDNYAEDAEGHTRSWVSRAFERANPSDVRIESLSDDGRLNRSLVIEGMKPGAGINQAAEVKVECGCVSKSSHKVS